MTQVAPVMVYSRMPATVVKTVKLPKALAAALARAAKERGCTESELIREGIERVTSEDEGIDMVKALGDGAASPRSRPTCRGTRSTCAGSGDRAISELGAIRYARVVGADRRSTSIGRSSVCANQRSTSIRYSSLICSSLKSLFASGSAHTSPPKSSRGIRTSK